MPKESQPPAAREDGAALDRPTVPELWWSPSLASETTDLIGGLTYRYVSSEGFVTPRHLRRDAVRLVAATHGCECDVCRIWDESGIPVASPPKPPPNKEDTTSVQRMAKELHTLVRNGKEFPYSDGEERRYYELVVTRWLEKLPKSDTATVLAELREEMTGLIGKYEAQFDTQESDTLKKVTAGVYHALALVEAAQARLTGPGEVERDV